ncbi:MAG: hypothetical protein RSC05_12275 [Acinetobacter sp.]
MKRLMILILLCSCFASASLGEVGYKSIMDIQAETPDRWTETYQTKWRTIEIDVPIELPNAEQFPVIQVKPSDKLDPSLIADYEYINVNDPGFFSGSKDKYHAEMYDYPVTLRQKTLGVFENGAIPDIQPENNSISYQTALDVGLKELYRLFGLLPDELRLAETKVYSGFYRSEYKNSHERLWYEYVSGCGEYHFRFEQLFYGISMEPATECYHNLFPKNESIFGYKPLFSIEVTSADSFCLWGSHYQSTNVIHEDIPIASFFDAKAVIEEEIKAGHLRSVDSIKLCYIPYLDPSDKTVVWLLPAWYVKGGYTRNAKREFTPWYNADGVMVDDGIERREVVFQANIGELIDYNAKGQKRRHVPKITTWDDLR